MQSCFTILLQSLNPSRSRLATPYDSTIGVGPGFYWVGFFVLLFLVCGTLKAYHDDRKWRGKTYNLVGKRRSIKYVD
jgi:hypothetical protein